MTSTDTGAINRPARRAVLYASWWQAGQFFPSDVCPAIYIRYGSAMQRERGRERTKCNARLTTPSGYASGEGWDMVGEYNDGETVRNLLDRSEYRQVMDIFHAGQADTPLRRFLIPVARDARTIDTIVAEPRLAGGRQLVAKSANEHTMACRAFSRSMVLAVISAQGQLTDDKPCRAFHLLARPCPTGIPPPHWMGTNVDGLEPTERIHHTT